MGPQPDQFDAIDIQEVPGGFPHLPDLTALLAHWRSKCQAGRLPARGDFPPAELRPWIGLVSLLDVSEDPRRFRWRLIGSRIVERTGRDRTGMWLDEIYSGAALRDFHRLFEKAVARREPLALSGSLQFLGKRHVAFCTMVMPLAEDGEHINMLMVGMHFDI